MKDKENFYCEIAFWKVLSNALTCVDNLNDPFNKGGRSHCAQKLFDSLLLKSDSVHFDDEQMFNSTVQDDEVLLKFWKLSECEGYPDITINRESYKQINEWQETDPNSIHLVCGEKNKNEGVSKGLLVLTPEVSLSSPDIYRDFGKSIKKNAEVSWKDILVRANHPCNSMIIFDNYVFNKPQENLYKILDCLLPNELSVPFHLAIFTSTLNNPLEVEFEKLQTYISNIRKDLKIELALYQAGKNDFHDRAIITNNIWIGSGGGFELLKKVRLHSESSKTTSVPIFFPYLQESTDWAIETYLNFIDDARKACTRCTHVGSRTHRLLHRPT